MSARPFPVVVFLLFVGSFVRDSAAETIEDTSEWKSCMANPRPCWRLNLAGRGLTGRIPWQISRLRYLRYLQLNDNKLEGTIPSEIQYLTILEGLELANNNLEGQIPGNSIWGYSCTASASWAKNKMDAHLHTLDLHGNKFTGTVPSRIWQMAAYKGCMPLVNLDVSDNLLSGPIRTHFTKYKGETPTKLTSVFTNLWLLGNNWDDAPCVGLCGEFNTGTMTDGKRALTKTWANKCMARTDLHDGLPASGEYVDEMGRCSFKSATCGRGNLYNPLRSILNPDCKRCPVHTYQPKSGHTETECYPQPSCDRGQFISKDKDDLRIAARTCTACPDNTYQSEQEHRLTGCINQPTCSAGQYITEDSKTARRACKNCPAGQYQDQSEHRETSCIKQTPCPAGTEFQITFTEKRRCTPCNQNAYQGSTDPSGAKSATCFAQPTCAVGQRISTDSASSRRACTACPAGQYQDQSEHRETSCIKQTPCPAGTEFQITFTEKRRCTPCNQNAYQGLTDPSGAKSATCFAQPTCAVGQRISTDSASSRRACIACPAGQYQDQPNHRETSCINQPVCSPDELFTTTSTARRQCEKCSSNEYQPTQDSKALQAFCIEQTFCGVGQRMSPYSQTKRRTCSDCPAGQYQDDSEHRSTTCIEQPKCGPGTLFKGSLYAERTCDACPPNTYQTAIDHTEPTCIPQQGCLPQQEFVGTSTTKGRCEPCKDGAVQPKNNHFDACIDPSRPTTVCNGVGELSRDGTCECNADFAGPQCEFSNEETCNGFGRVSYNAQANAASCSNCTDPAVGVGDRCQFSNSETCKDFGIVSGDGTCDWNRDPFDEPIVPECPPGYYYNPNPETAGNEAEEEDAIEVRADGCYPCSPGEFASDKARRVQCDVCPTLQTSEAASESDSGCFAKFQSAAADQQFCYGKGSITSDVAGTVDTKPLSRITSSEDCSSSAASLGFTFAGEYVLPYPGCVYDATHQEARFYVDQSTYDTRVSVASAHGNNRHNDDENNDRRRRRRQEHQQHQQRQRKEQQPREQDQQPRQSGSKKRRRKWVLVPKKDTPLCEVYVCKDPENDVTPLTSDPANADKFPSCRVSDAQIQAAVQEESETNRKTFVPAMMSIAVATLGGSYGYQHWSAKKSGGSVDWYDVWIHIHVWLTFLRAIDIQSDFGFYFISLRGAFLEAYGDGNPETNPYTEPNVAAFMFAAVFFTALGLFLSPFDIWVMGRRTAGDTLSMFSILIIISISLLEDLPQTVLAGIYMRTMNAAGIKPDAVAILSFIVSAVSLLFSCSTVYTHVQKLRDQDPTGWWRIGGAEGGAENARLRAEVSKLQRENALLKRSNSFAAHMTNPMTTMQASENDFFTDGVQETLETASGGSAKREEEMFGGLENTADLCESEQKTGKKCTKKKAKKSAYCTKHTCTKEMCQRWKARKAEYCKKHAGTDM